MRPTDGAPVNLMQLIFTPAYGQPGIGNFFLVESQHRGPDGPAADSGGGGGGSDCRAEIMANAAESNLDESAFVEHKTMDLTLDTSCTRRSFSSSLRTCLPVQTAFFAKASLTSL